MKNKIFFLLILFSYSVSAIPTIELQHDNTQPGETMFAIISTSGKFVEELRESQVKFFKGRKQISLETEILLYNNTYYLSIYTGQEANITLQVENILYKETETLSSATISKNFTTSKNILTNSETNQTYTKILRIRPGFIFSSNPKLKLANLGTSQLNITYNEEEISISPLTSYELEFTPEKPFSQTKISSYKDFLIPTFYVEIPENMSSPVITISPEENLTAAALSADLRQISNLTSIETSTETSSQALIQLFNMGTENITNLKFSSSLDFIKTEDLQDMSGRGIQNITLELDPKVPGNFQGTINISYMQNGTENILEIPLNVFILPKGTTKENFTETTTEKCEDIGQVCETGFICNGTATFTNDYTKYCCQDSCISIKEESSESSSYGWLVGLVILAILGYIGYYFYKKQKQIAPPTSKDTLSLATEKFEKRLAGNQTKRTTGNLAKS